MKKILAIFLIALMAFAGAALAENGGLPVYAYPGNDPVEAAAAAYTVKLGENFLLEDGSVTIPAPVILKTAEQEFAGSAVCENKESEDFLYE